MQSNERMLKGKKREKNVWEHNNVLDETNHGEGRTKAALLSVCTRSFLWMDEVMSDVTISESNAPQRWKG